MLRSQVCLVEKYSHSHLLNRPVRPDQIHVKRALPFLVSLRHSQPYPRFSSRIGLVLATSHHSLFAHPFVSVPEGGVSLKRVSRMIDSELNTREGLFT